jgi:hypothetical protein
MEARLGEQSEVVQKWFLKYTPSRARRSMCGVWRWGLPWKLRASQRWSSVRMMTTFGRSGDVAVRAVFEVESAGDRQPG